METGKLLEILPVAECLTDGADKAGFSEYLQQPRERTLQKIEAEKRE